MQPSPIQLKQLFFRHILITPKNEKDDNLIADGFDFNGVTIHDGTRVKLVESTSDEYPVYCVTLRINIKNEVGKICPYSLDMEAVGFFEVLKKDLSKDKLEELAHINGCSILYSVIREFIMNFTTRCARGALILPTVNFLDKINKKAAEETSQEKDKTPTKKKRMAKSK